MSAPTPKSHNVLIGSRGATTNNKHTKALIGKFEVLIFIYPKRKACHRVLRVSSAESWFSSTKIWFERLKLGQAKQSEIMNYTNLLN